MAETPNLSLVPKCQTALVGHQLAHRQLQHAFQSQAMHPVWLLTGERGIGKATLAYTMAREILKDNGQDPALIARQMAQGSYPNFLAIERNAAADGKIPKEITAEEGRKVNAFLNQCAAIPGWRVIIIDAIDEMNRTAAHALLKILEEPPHQTLFFLVAHSLGQVLPTIRSRCCKLQLSPLTPPEITENLGNAFPEELLPLSRGSLGRALALHQAGGLKLLDHITQSLKGALKGDWRPAQALSATFDKDNPYYETLLDLILWVLHEGIALAHLSAPDTSINKSLQTLINLKPITHWVDAYHHISQFLETARTSHLDRNHILMAIFFIIENPTVGDAFIYEPF